MVNESFAEPIPGTVASIALPAELKNQLAADGNKTRFQFQFYGVQDLLNVNAHACRHATHARTQARAHTHTHTHTHTDTDRHFNTISGL